MPSVYKNKEFITVKQNKANPVHNNNSNGMINGSAQNIGINNRPVLWQGARAIPNGEKPAEEGSPKKEEFIDTADTFAQESPLRSREEVLAEYEALRSEYIEESEHIRSEAKKWAEEYIDKTKNDIEKLYKDAAVETEQKKILADKNGYNDGYERGLTEGNAKGYEEGYTKGLRKCKDTLKELMTGLAEIPSQKDVIFKKYERELFDAIFTIATKVTLDSLKQKEKSVIQKMLREAAKNFRNSEYIKVTLSKLDTDEMGEAELDSLKEIFRENQHIEFEILKDAPEGTMILDNGSEITDAGIATQLMMIEKLGKGKFRDKQAEEQN